MKLIEIYNYLESFAPLEFQESYDNSGLQMGDLEKDVKKGLLSLDLTQQAVKRALKENFDFILTHHPILFHPLKSLDRNQRPGKLLLPLAEKGISVIAWHTNLDRALGGVNDVLAKALSIHVDGDLVEEENKPGMGRVGSIKEQRGEELAEHVRRTLEAPYIITYGNASKKIERVALLGGSGADFISNAIEKKVDAYITADIRYHDTEEALDKDLFLIDAGHYYSEQVMMEELKKLLEKEFSTVEFQVEKRNFQNQVY